ncbi:hypothetical protein [Megamonas sp.]|uniref:C1q-like domain-containing protein n=1 Tax=Megamonas sp. TaxID=2049033 RepID=UPI002588EBDE|nr:hypothetical protein [Megamonas sp.]
MSFLIGSARTTIASLKNGEIGTPGPAGEDGKTSYVHIAYSNSEDGSLDFSTSDSSNRAYIGMYTDFTELDSTDHTKYTWQRTKGEQGESGRDGVAGKDGVGLKNTEVLYAKSTNGQTPPESGWTEQVPVVPGGQFLWTKTTWTYTDNSSESGYSVAKMGQDGNKGDDGIAGKDGVGISETVIEYAPGNDGVTKPTTGWTSAIPTVAAGKYLWTRTTWSYTDGTSEVGYTVAKQGEKGDKGDKGDTGRDGIAGKDGVGLRSTTVTYAASTSGTVSPSTGWQEQVPTVAPSNFLWTRTVWTYTDGTSETGYSVAKMGKDGAKGNDGIAGKDGVGIDDTLIEYAVSTSGTIKPTSGWSTTIPSTPQGQYLWTRTTWTYTDNTTEQGFTVARQGEKGDKGDQGIAGPKGADGRTQYTHIAYADTASGGGFSQSPTGKAYIGMYVDFEELDSSDPTRYAWSLIKGADGEQGVAGPKGEDGKTPYFHTAYTNSADFGAYDYSGNPNLFPNVTLRDLSGEFTGMSVPTNVTEGDGYFVIDVTQLTGNKGYYFLNIPRGKVGERYTYSVEAKADVNTQGIAIRPVYHNGTALAVLTSSSVGSLTTNFTRYNMTTNALTGVQVNSAIQAFQVYIVPADCVAKKIYVKYNIKLEKGVTATPYQPNLLDAPWYFSTVPLGENIADPTVNFPIKTTGYRVYGVNMLEEFKLGQRYTLTMKATKPASQTFWAYNGGNISLERMTPVEGLTDVWSCSFTILKIDSGSPSLLSIYQTQQSTAGSCQIDWLKIEKGDTRTPNIDDYKYLGNYTDFVQADSLNPTKYSWSLIKGADGETQYTHIAYANSSDGVDGFTTVYPNLNLLDGTKDFSGTWNNSSHWVTDGTYKGLSVKKRTSQWNGIYKTFTAPKDGVYTFSAYIKSSGDSAKVYRYGGVNSPSSQATIQQHIGSNFDWTRDSVTLNLRANDSVWIRYEISGTGTDSILWTAGHKYELSSASTPYMPSDSEVITDDYPSYIGQYTDFTQVNSTNPSDYTWSLIRGNDGTPAKLLSLQADSYVMKFDTNGNIISGQTISLSAIVQNMSGTVTWLATPYIGTTAQPPLTLTGSGNTRTISESQWDKTVTKVIVKVTLGDFEDTIIINKLQDGAKGQDGADGRDGVAGKDGVGLKSTAITYAGSANGTTPPSTGWQTQVPTVPAGQFLWTRTIWTYTDNSNETGYSVAKMGQNGNNGKDGIAGKDGVGIKTTLIEYAVGTSGTTRPTSGWTSSIPSIPQGQYLWTRTTWTYTDNTTEQGFTVAHQGSNGQNGTNGTNGSDGKPAFFHTAWANSPDGTLNFSKTDSLNKSYIGTYSDSVQEGSNDPTKYKWTELVGALVIDSTNYALESRYNWRPKQLGSTESYYNILLDKPIPKGTKIQVGTDYSWVSGNKPTVDGVKMVAVTSGGGHAGVELNLTTAPDSGTITMSGTLTSEMSVIRLYNGSSGKGQNNIYQFENTVVNIGDKLCGWQPNYKDTPQRNNLLTNSTGQLGDGNWIIPVNTWEILSPEKDKPTSNIFHSKGSTSVSDMIYQNPHPIQVKAGQIIVVSFDYKENMSCGEMFSIRTFSEANKGPAEFLENWNVPRSLLEKSIQNEWIRVTYRLLVRKDGYLDFILANRSTNASAQNWFREIMVTTNGSLQGDYSWYQPDYTSSAVNEANQTIPRVYVQSLAPQKVKDGDQWWKMNNNKITNYYVYGGGKWNEQTIDQSVLNIATLNAVNINGSVVAGSTFVNEYTNVTSGLNQVTDGSLKIENGILQAGASYYLTNNNGDRLYKFATTDADIHQGTLNLIQRLYDESGRQTSQSTTSVSGGLINLSLSDSSGNYHGVLDAKALTKTSWINLTLSDDFTVAENNPPQYRIIYNLDGSKTIKYRGQVKLKSGTMTTGKAYTPFRPGGVSSIPSEIRPEKTIFAYAGTGVGSGTINHGGQLACTASGYFSIGVAQSNTTYASISGMFYDIG